MSVPWDWPERKPGITIVKEAGTAGTGVTGN